MIQEAPSEKASGRKPAPGKPAPPNFTRRGGPGPDTLTPQLPFGRELLIHAARQRARGISWEIIAEKTPHSAGDLVTFSIDQPEIWGPLYARAEKLRLQEADGEGLAHLTTLLKGEDEQAAEKAARELLIHRRHIERSRGDMYRKSAEGGSGTCPPTATHDQERWFAEDPAPEELHRPIIYTANRVAHGEAYAPIARETGHDAEAVARWAFVYPKTWDRVYPQARLAAAQFGAALAINRLLDLAAGPDAKLAARAARTLLVHRRHMHWGSTYPSSVTQVSVAVGGDGSVARRSGPARSCGTVRPSASVSSVSSAVKRSLPRARDGP